MDQRICPICNEAFVLSGRGRPRIYCSSRCSRTATRDNLSKQCSVTECDRPVRAKGLCGSHYNRGRYTWEQRKGSPQTRRANLRRKTQRRRALVSDPEAESIERDDIGLRDDWVCGICADPVDNSIRWPKPLSASLDHILPLSRGGKHTTANVRITHLGCNMSRGNHMDADARLASA